jgi:hypothetical protein
MRVKPIVLFLSARNAARSQIEAFREVRDELRSRTHAWLKAHSR